MALRTQMVGTSYLVLPDGAPPHPGVVVIHELYDLHDNIRDIRLRFAEQGYAGPRSGPVWSHLVERPEVDDRRVGAVGFCLGGTLELTWACTDRRLKAIGPYYGSAPRRRETLRRLCPVVGSWPENDFTSGAAGTLETELTSAGVAHDLKLYPGAKHSFFNDRESNYDAAAATDSWQRVLSFFDERIKAGRNAP